MLASLLHVSQPHTHSHTLLKDVVDVQVSPLLNPMSPAMDTNMDVLLADVKSLFESPLQPKNLYNMSRRLQDEFRQKLESSNISMLPSFHHTLPTGQEQGTILALDVGGSTFRIALIDLTGRKELRQESNGEADGLKIKRLKSFPIDDSVRSLRGRLFFDWMACRIEEVLDADDHQAEKKVSGPLPMSLAWSFPIEETSSRSGSLLAMGKGFLATSGVEGQDICELVTSACQARSLNVELQGIVNDASATLLSQAYRDPSTRISLIMGTGINSAVYLPLNSLGKEKFGERESSWWNEARHVLVNTELSMFGKHIWESTRWDDKLNAAHPLPDFQPLEYKVGGRFLGELVRLVVVEAVHQGVIFNGAMPKGLDVAYGFDTGLIGVFESDTTPDLSIANANFTTAHPLPYHAPKPSPRDLHFIRTVSTLVTSRAAAYVATAVHALWTLQQAAASSCPSCISKTQESDTKATIACNGSIMEKYPGFKKRCQGFLDKLVRLSGGGTRCVSIEMAVESSVFGAAVAAVAEG